MKRALERRIFVSLSFFPVIAYAVIYFGLPMLTSMFFHPTGTVADWGMMGLELVVAFWTGILVLCFVLVPSAVITIMGIVHTVGLWRRKENSVVFIILTVIAALPLLYLLDQYLFFFGRFIPATTAYGPY